jgi:molybdopterin-guanine dinucleotide biosynthesis adapter protein
VGTIKHTHHLHELDTPGKDSHRQREAGATVVGIMSQGMNAVFLPAEHQPTHIDRYAVMLPLFADCDLVLVEEDSQTNAPKIEVWRAELSIPPIALEDRGVLAIVTDDAPPCVCLMLKRSDIKKLADWIEQIAKKECK